MRIPLSDGQRSTLLHLDLNKPDWKYPKNPWEGYCIYPLPLPPPFEKLFLKRFRGKKAPAHDLLVAGLRRGLPASTPRIYGAGKEDQDYIYAFECLPEGYQTLNTWLENRSGVSYLTPELMLRVATQAESLFSAIGRKPFEHVFTDCCTKNMMYDPRTGSMVFIDLASAWPYELLHQRANSPAGGEFDIYFWKLWFQYPLARQSHQHYHLPRMMVLSFAATYGRALGLLNHPE